MKNKKKKVFVHQDHFHTMDVAYNYSQYLSKKYNAKHFLIEPPKRITTPVTDDILRRLNIKAKRLKKKTNKKNKIHASASSSSNNNNSSSNTTRPTTTNKKKNDTSTTTTTSSIPTSSFYYGTNITQLQNLTIQKVQIATPTSSYLFVATQSNVQTTFQQLPNFISNIILLQLVGGSNHNLLTLSSFVTTLRNETQHLLDMLTQEHLLLEDLQILINTQGYIYHIDLDRIMEAPKHAKLYNDYYVQVRKAKAKAMEQRKAQATKATIKMQTQMQHLNTTTNTREHEHDDDTHHPASYYYRDYDVDIQREHEEWYNKYYNRVQQILTTIINGVQDIMIDIVKYDDDVDNLVHVDNRSVVNTNDGQKPIIPQQQIQQLQQSPQVPRYIHLKRLQQDVSALNTQWGYNFPLPNFTISISL